MEKIQKGENREDFKKLSELVEQELKRLKKEEKEYKPKSDEEILKILESGKDIISMDNKFYDINF